jgi:hypothetical protein
MSGAKCSPEGLNPADAAPKSGVSIVARRHVDRARPETRNRPSSSDRSDLAVIGPAQILPYGQDSWRRPDFANWLDVRSSLSEPRSIWETVG